MTTDDLDDFEMPEEGDEVVPAPSPPPAVEPDDDETVEVFNKKGEKVVPLTREDADNADFYLERFGKNVRYDHTTGEWFIWHKGVHHWRLDDHEEIKSMALHAARWRVKKAVDEDSTDKFKIASVLLGLNARNRALEDLRARDGVAIGWGHWNMDLNLFCVANGVINLQDGSLRPGEQTDNINRASKVTYEPMALCPRWETFLLEVFQTQEMVDYVQRIVGYCMTGLTTEQVWFLLYGTGGNGKNVLVSILQRVFGSKQYYEEAAGETFITRWGQSSGSNNVDELKNARLVVANEVPDKSTFDAGRLKALTGGSDITARALYKNLRTWTPQLKLMMLVNHLPSTTDDSPGFWRRIRTVPFEVSFIGRENPHLVDELLTELPGILNWCVAGAVTWFQSGLGDEPASAVALKTEYKEETDPLGMFINDCIVETKNAADTIAAREVFRIYATWCAGEGHTPMNLQVFGRAGAMQELGLGKHRTETGVVYRGIRVYDPTLHSTKGIAKSD